VNDVKSTMKKNMKHLYTLVAAACIANLAAAQSLPPPPVSPTPVTTYEYDAQGNRTKVTQGAGTGTGALNLQTTTTFDKLGRLKDATDPKNGKTQFQYDGGDRTTQVTDPRNLVTQYPRNGFGDATQLISPDTGPSSYTYDEAGNVLTRVDSRGVTETYTYDPVGRLTQVVYSQAGQAAQTVSWSWSLTGADYANSIGRLSRTDHPAGSSRFKYDAQGRVTQAVQTVNAATGANSAPVVTTVQYGYTLGKLSSITYPSGRKLTFVYTNGQVTGLSLAPDEAGTAATLLSQISGSPSAGSAAGTGTWRVEARYRTSASSTRADASCATGWATCSAMSPTTRPIGSSATRTCRPTTASRSRRWTRISATTRTAGSRK
jgi:YD repeat-containing protein